MNGVGSIGRLFCSITMVVVMVCFFSCTTELPDRQLLIDEIYSARVKQVEIEKRGDCRKKQLERAEAKVDSILHSLLNADLHDTLNFPARPQKPLRPDPIIGTVKKFDLGQ